jgi:hypothetical protein
MPSLGHHPTWVIRRARDRVIAAALRWEWRTFGEQFGGAEERLASMQPQRVAESDETYLLSTQAGLATERERPAWAQGARLTNDVLSRVARPGLKRGT